MAEDKYNLKNPSVKRILQEMKEMQNNPSDDYISMPLEDNIFEWQFAIRGPRDTEFEGGIYHGRIQLPPEYPFKPPSFMLLTPNGRFETQTKICLSISQYHPEHWQPSWSVRTALVALIAFMPTKGNGAIGSLEFTKEERRALAIKSLEAPPKYGNEVRQMLINEVHEQMLARSCKGGEPVATSEKVEEPKDSVLPLSDAISDVIDFEPAASNVGEAGSTGVPENEGGEQQVMEHRVQEVQTHTVENARDAARQEVVVVARQPPPSDDWGLTLLAIGLSVALIALLIKKIFKSQWGWVNI